MVTEPLAIPACGHVGCGHEDLEELSEALPPARRPHPPSADETDGDQPASLCFLPDPLSVVSSGRNKKVELEKPWRDSEQTSLGNQLLNHLKRSFKS